MFFSHLFTFDTFIQQQSLSPMVSQFKKGWGVLETIFPSLLRASVEV